MGKLMWAIDINNPASWESVDNEGIGKEDIIKKADNIKELVHIRNIEDVEGVYNSLEYVEAVLEDRVPLYV